MFINKHEEEIKTLGKEYTFCQTDCIKAVVSHRKYSMLKAISPIYVYRLGFCHHERSPSSLIVPLSKKKQSRNLSSRCLNLFTLSCARKGRGIVCSFVWFLFMVCVCVRVLHLVITNNSELRTL